MTEKTARELGLKNVKECFDKLGFSMYRDKLSQNVAEANATLNHIDKEAVMFKQYIRLEVFEKGYIGRLPTNCDIVHSFMYRNVDDLEIKEGHIGYLDAEQGSDKKNISSVAKFDSVKYDSPWISVWDKSFNHKKPAVLVFIHDGELGGGRNVIVCVKCINLRSKPRAKLRDYINEQIERAVKHEEQTKKKEQEQAKKEEDLKEQQEREQSKSKVVEL